MNKTKIDGIAFSTIASFCGAIVPVFSKVVIEYFSPQVALFLRMSVSLVLIGLLLVFFLKPKIQVDSTTLRIAIFGAMNFVFLMYGIKFIPAVLVPIFYSLVPIEVTIFSFILYRERISFMKLSGIFIGYFGALFVLYPTFSGANTQDIKIIGAALIFFGSCSVALFSLFIQKSEGKYSPYNLSFQSIFLAFFFSLPMLFIQNGDTENLKNFDLKVVWFILAVAVIGTIGQYVIFQNAIAKIQSSANVIFFYFQPLFVVFLSLIFLEENLEISYFVGLIFVLIGSSLNLGIHSKMRALMNKKTTGS